MTEDRIEKQYEMAVANPKAIVGSRFVRVPENSTVRYTAWANRLTQEQLYTQVGGKIIIITNTLSEFKYSVTMH